VRAFLRDGESYVAKLETVERLVVTGLMEQARQLLSPEVEATGDVFADLAASMGVSLAAEDQVQAEADADADSDGDEGEDDDGYGDERRDPALDRLLPDAHRGDEKVAAEFRRLTEEGLRQRKSANLDLALTRLAAAADNGLLVLANDEAPPFITALTDVRLLLGERMGMRTEDDAERLHAAVEAADDDDPLVWAMVWYDMLTFLQESLADALLGEPWGEHADDDEPV
jgi:hypothetical protein